jgi:hypothetical protein
VQKREEKAQQRAEAKKSKTGDVEPDSQDSQDSIETSAPSTDHISDSTQLSASNMFK